MANYWMHNGFLNVSGEKMSKSLGNFFTVHELLDQYPGEVIRLLLMTAHYRQPLDFTHDGLQSAKATLDRWYGQMRGKTVTPATTVPASVEDALSDDLNTPLAISAIHQLDDPAAAAGRRPGARPAAAGCRGVVPLDADRHRRADRSRDRGGDRRPSGRAQGEGLQGSRPPPRRPQGQGRDPRGRAEGHDLEAGLGAF